MASVPTTHLVIFIAAIVVSTGIAGVVVDSAEEYGESLQSAQAEHAKDIETDVAIINDPGKPSASYDESSDTLTLYVKNTGERQIPATPGKVTVLVNGTRHDVTDVTIHDDTRWREGVVVELTVDVVLPSNTETRVIVEVSGARDRYDFTSP